MPFVEHSLAEPPLILALDIGTSSVRALLFDREARSILDSEVQERYDVTTTADGGVEADADHLFDLTLRCLDGVARTDAGDNSKIAAVATSCFWHSLIGVDRDGAAVTPVYYWADTRSSDDVAPIIQERDTAALHQRTGCPPHSSYWLSKLRWLRRTRPELLARVHRWCSFGEYVIARLHGLDAATVSFAMASGTGLLDVRRLVWDKEALAIAGIDAQSLSPLVDLDEPVRSLYSRYRDRWPLLNDVPWFPAIGDGACANIGGGAVGRARLALTLGTSGALRMATSTFDVTLPGQLWLYRIDRTRGVLGGALSNGGNITVWLRDLMGLDVSSGQWRAAEAMEPDAHGLTVLPFIAGERAPAWNIHAHGVIAGLRLTTDPPALLRAALEAVAYRFALIYEALAPFTPADHEIVAGGGAILNSPAWSQIVADVLLHSIVAPPPDEEASARGAAVAALTALGVFPDLDAAPDPVADAETFAPDPVRHARYRVGLARHRRLESRLFPAGGAWDQVVSD